jgi:hypothetical protein
VGLRYQGGDEALGEVGIGWDPAGAHGTTSL